MVLQLPDYMAAAISAYPLTVDVNVDIDVEMSTDVYGQVGCWNRLSQGRCRSDWRQEGEHYLKWWRWRGVCKLSRRGDGVGQVCCGCIEARTLIGTVGYIEASGSQSVIDRLSG